ncbi:hypothetical protein EMCG_05046 [[Emmonsia] crescens]|uniref:Extracellular membrane protein CFEM domain-containing protein n=1 Tax=[Emmonsia] crescens TaxID=73230 RepID=A0A0G2J6Q6_9EURO|nr:hypothetical protein EMCG_05046 [Emmonsia crescens UAMH 3008]
MARLSALLVLFGLLSTTLASAKKPIDFDEINRNAQCDNDCFFGSFPPGSCTNDPACTCTQQKYRETYFCCMGKKCASSVLPDSVQRLSLDCEGRSLPFTFDAEAVCGIKLTTSSATSASATSTSAGLTGSQTSSGAPAPTTTPNSAPGMRVMLKAAVIIVAASGILC